MVAETRQDSDLYRVDDVVVDVGARRVFRGKQELNLPKLSFDLLAALVSAAPNTLSVDELIDQVWDGVVVGSATVAKRVELLRQALGDDSRDPRYVALVRGHGYRLIPQPVRGDRPAAKTTAWPLLALVAAVAVIAGIGWYLVHHADAPPDKSIAVMPFANLSQETANNFLSDGLTAELTNRLTTMPDLKVAAMTSAFTFKGSDADVAEVAEQLRVSHVLSGSVRQSGGRLRITAQLTDAGNGYHVWSDSWERELSDIFEIQDEIAEAVVDSLRLQLLQDTRPVQTTDPEAYALYLQGKSEMLNKKEPDLGQATPERLTHALELTTHALAIDPEYAAAWAQLAFIQFNQAQWIFGGDPGEMYARAEASAKRALELDPHQAGALTVLGAINNTWHWDAEAAADWYRRAMTVAPGRASTLNAVAVLYDRLGRPDIAHRYFQAAFDLDPLNSQTAINLAWSYWLIGDHDAAREQLEHAKRIAPRAVRVQAFEALFAYLEGDYERAAELSEELNEPLYACSLYRMERVEQASATLEELRSADEPGAVAIASVFACRRDRDGAFEWLQRAYDERTPALGWVRSNVHMEPLHDDPRWKALLGKVGVSNDDLVKVIAALGN